MATHMVGGCRYHHISLHHDHVDACGMEGTAMSDSCLTCLCMALCCPLYILLVGVSGILLRSLSMRRSSYVLFSAKGNTQ